MNQLMFPDFAQLGVKPSELSSGKSLDYFPPATEMKNYMHTTILHETLTKVLKKELPFIVIGLSFKAKIDSLFGSSLVSGIVHNESLSETLKASYLVYIIEHWMNRYSDDTITKAVNIFNTATEASKDFDTVIIRGNEIFCQKAGNLVNRLQDSAFSYFEILEIVKHALHKNGVLVQRES